MPWQPPNAAPAHGVEDLIALRQRTGLGATANLAFGREVKEKNKVRR
jgi:hypothetical protein